MFILIKTWLENALYLVKEIEDITWTSYQITEVLSLSPGFNENIRAYFSGEEMYDDFCGVYFWRIPQVRQLEITKLNLVYTGVLVVES